MSTKAKRKRHSAAFKAKVGMEAVLGIKTVAQIAREYSVHPVQVSQWKAVIRDRLPELFESGGKAGEDTERLVADLHQKIGELTVDLDFMKKNLDLDHDPEIKSKSRNLRRTVPGSRGWGR